MITLLIVKLNYFQN